MNEYRILHCKDQQKIFNALAKYGWDAFNKEIFCEAETKEELDCLEKKYIIKFDCIKNGFNLKHGGQSSNTYSEESRANMSLAAIKRYKDPKEREKMAFSKMGSKNPRFGKPDTDAMRISKAKAQEKRWAEPGARQKQSESMSGENHWNFGNKVSEEVKTKQSISAKKRFENPAERQKISARNSKKIYCFNNNTFYTSVIEASRVLKINKSSISRQLLGKVLQVQGYTFRYA